MSKKPDPLAAVKARRAEGCIGIGIPAGWTDLMVELHERLMDAAPDLRYIQIKQKFGELRVYVSGATDEARALINAAELRSRTVCEECGAPGNPCQRRGWYRALCPTHAAEGGYTVADG